MSKQQTNVRLVVHSGGGEVQLTPSSMPSLLHLAFEVVASVAVVFGFLWFCKLGQSQSMPYISLFCLVPWIAGGFSALFIVLRFFIQGRAQGDPFAMADRKEIRLPRQSLIYPRDEVIGTATIVGSHRDRLSEHDQQIHVLSLVTHKPERGGLSLSIIAEPRQFYPDRLLRQWASESSLRHFGIIDIGTLDSRSRSGAWRIAKEQIQEIMNNTDADT